jgi:hypothetical protein
MKGHMKYPSKAGTKVRLNIWRNYWTGRRWNMKTIHETQVTTEVKVRFPLYTTWRHTRSGGWVRLKPDGTRWRMGGEVKGKLMNGVGSQYSHTTSERGVSSITNADAHTSAASSRMNWRPRRFKWTRPFLRKTKSGFCACAIMFQTHSTIQIILHPGTKWGWVFSFTRWNPPPVPSEQKGGGQHSLHVIEKGKMFCPWWDSNLVLRSSPYPTDYTDEVCGLTNNWFCKRSILF